MQLWTTHTTIVKERAGYQQRDARMSAEPVKPAKAAEAVAKHIEGLILEGSLRPGERLRAERELAERLAVSRPTVREGLQLLQQQGLLTREPGSGAAVAAIGTSITDPLAKLLCSRSETTDDYLEFRQAVDGAAAELAANPATEIDLEAITRCMRRIEGSHGKDDPIDEAEADADLHIAVYEAAHNVVLLHVMRALAQMLRADVFYNRDKLYSRRGVRDLLLEQHAAIHAAIMARDPQAARIAAERHINFTRTATKEITEAEARIEVSLRRLDGALSAGDGMRTQ